MKRPGKIVCVGRNYRAHARELGNEVPAAPLLFLKPPSSIVADGGAIVLPLASSRVEYEGEIGVLLARPLRRAAPGDTLAAVGGVVAVNDVTARDLQRTDGQWTRAKGFDTFCPLASETLVEPDLAALTVSTRVNGVERQCATAAEMVFSIPELLSYISHVMTLEPGDLVATGTPAGVGPLLPGDTVEVEVRCGARASRVANPVVADA